MCVVVLYVDVMCVCKVLSLEHLPSESVCSLRVKCVSLSLLSSLQFALL